MYPGVSGVSELIVREEDLVSHAGGVSADVLSTPRLIQLMESAAVKAVEAYLLPDQLTLGTRVDIRHLAATPVGMKVTAHALLKATEKNRLYFVVDAYDEQEKVAEGEHERVLVSRGRFLQRVETKKQGKTGSIPRKS